MSSSVMRRAWLVAAFGFLVIAGTAGAAPRITEYSVAQPSVFPCTTAVDRSTGNIYFSAMLGPTPTSVGSIGVLDPAARAVRKIPLPSPLAAPGGIAFGPGTPGCIPGPGNHPLGLAGLEAPGAVMLGAVPPCTPIDPP